MGVARGRLLLYLKLICWTDLHCVAADSDDVFGNSAQVWCPAALGSGHRIKSNLLSKETKSTKSLSEVALTLSAQMHHPHNFASWRNGPERQRENKPLSEGLLGAQTGS